MTEYQIGTWFFFLIVGLIFCLSVPTPNNFAALGLVLLTYPIFCRAVNALAKYLKSKLMKDKSE